MASHKKACAVYGVAYGRRMSISGRQHREGRGFSVYVHVNAGSNSKEPHYSSMMIRKLALRIVLLPFGTPTMNLPLYQM